MKASWQKSKRYGWCIRLDFASADEPFPALGSPIEVFNRDGKMKREFVGGVVFKREGSGLQALVRKGRDPLQAVEIRKLDYVEPAWATGAANVKAPRARHVIHKRRGVGR